MQKWIMILSLVFFLGANLTIAIAGGSGKAAQSKQGEPQGGPGPAPNSGNDGVADGSGWDRTGEEPNTTNDHPGLSNDGRGPAPGSGDGVADGPEW